MSGAGRQESGWHDLADKWQPGRENPGPLVHERVSMQEQIRSVLQVRATRRVVLLAMLAADFCVAAFQRRDARLSGVVPGPVAAGSG